MMEKYRNIIKAVREVFPNCRELRVNLITSKEEKVYFNLCGIQYIEDGLPNIKDNKIEGLNILDGATSSIDFEDGQINVNEE